MKVLSHINRSHNELFPQYYSCKTLRKNLFPCVMLYYFSWEMTKNSCLRKKSFDSSIFSKNRLPQPCKSINWLNKSFTYRFLSHSWNVERKLHSNERVTTLTNRVRLSRSDQNTYTTTAITIIYSHLEKQTKQKKYLKI